MFEAATGPGQSLPVVARLLTGLVEEARAAAAWSSGQRASMLAEVERWSGVLASVRAHLLVAERDSGAPLRAGDRSFEAARARDGRMGVFEATRQVQQADTLVTMPTVAAAVQAGVVPLAHLDVLARAAAQASPVVASRLASAAGQDTVVQLSRAHDGPRFARSLAQWVATMDPAALEADHEAQRRERFLTLSDQANGTFLKGRLDRMAGHRLRLALESVGEVPDDDRSSVQAGADALVAIAEHVLRGSPGRTGTGTDGDRTGTGADGDGPVTGATSRPHVSLLLPIETLAALRATEYPTRHAPVGVGDGATGGTGSGHPADTSGNGVPGGGAGATHRSSTADATDSGTAAADKTSAAGRWAWAGVPPATLEDGTPVPSSEVARILCDCDVTRVAITTDGVPLDLGRTKRVYTGAHRRAVIARDRQCAWNGCDRPARWGEIHHIRWWDRDNGPTSVSNAVLLCVYHHHEVHRRDLTIQRHTPPPGRPPGRPRRSAAAHATTLEPGLADTGGATGPGVAAGPGHGTGLGPGHGAGRGPGHGASPGLGHGARAGAPVPGTTRYTFRNRTGHVVNAPPDG